MNIYDMVTAEMSAYSEGAYADRGSARDMLTRFASAVAEAEREACAQLCEGMTARPNPYVTPDNARHFAAAIRARSNQS